EYDLSVAESKRYSQLGSSGAASQSEQDKAFANERNNLALLKQALANLSVAKEALKTAQVAKVGLQAEVNNAQAQLDQ
ncbi:HlyD family secretion protein, partial [Acinetobacter baumannii]